MVKVPLCVIKYAAHVRYRSKVWKAPQYLAAGYHTSRHLKVTYLSVAGFEKRLLGSSSYMAQNDLGQISVGHTRWLMAMSPMTCIPALHPRTP